MSLQKVTEKVNSLMSKDRISREDINKLTNEEADYFEKVATEKLNNTKGKELDKLLARLDQVITPESKNEIWENNHRRIIQEISLFIAEYGRMPLKIDLADRVGLSRQTLHKHLKEYKDNPAYSEHLQRFQLMTEKLIAKMFQFALQGNVKAGRLYFDMVGHMGGRVIRNQTNYIQVNNLVISEERLRALEPEQLRRIEEILAEVANGKTPE